MKTVTFQLIHTDGQLLSDPFTCEVNTELSDSKTLILHQKDKSVISIGDIVMQPRKINIDSPVKVYLTYGVPRRKKWSKTFYFAPIRIISIDEQ